MPTVLPVDGYRIKIFTHDHRPPHVHVTAHGCEVVFKHNCGDDDVSIREVKQFKATEVRAILKIVQAYQQLLCKIWEEVHGDIR